MQPRAATIVRRANIRRPPAHPKDPAAMAHAADTLPAGTQGEPARYDFDLFVIGAGSGGVRASRMSARFGARVAVAENRYLGGTCVNVGCVPKKLFVYGAEFAGAFADAEGFGWDLGERAFDWQRLRDNKTREIERLNGVYGRMLRDAGVTVYDGTARILDPHTVEVGGQRVTAEYILVATGGWPKLPDAPWRDLVVSSNEMFFLPSLPQRALVVGGGYIAVEFAGILRGLGVATTLMYRGPLFLRGFDSGVRRFVADELRKKDIDLRFDADIAGITRDDATGVLTVTLVDGSTVETDLVLCATGRAPNVEGLGLEAVGVRQRPNGAIEVDAHYRTSVPNILAIGDVTDRLQLTPVAIAEGMCVAKTLFGGQPSTLDYTNVATAVFCQPNIGTVGITEDEAIASGRAIRVFETSFRPMKHTLSGRDERTFMKLVVDAADDRVLGAHMVGDAAGEIIQGLAIALKAGVTKAVFDATVGIHPTAAEEFVTMREPRA